MELASGSFTHCCDSPLMSLYHSAGGLGCRSLNAVSRQRSRRHKLRRCPKSLVLSEAQWPTTARCRTFDGIKGDRTIGTEHVEATPPQLKQLLSPAVSLPQWPESDGVTRLYRPNRVHRPTIRYDTMMKI